MLPLPQDVAHFRSSLLPAAALVTSAFCLAGAMSWGTSAETVADPGASPETAEVLQCEVANARSHQECVREAEGKALIRRAEGLAVEPGDPAGATAIDPPGPADATVIVVRLARAGATSPGALR